MSFTKWLFGREDSGSASAPNADHVKNGLAPSQNAGGGVESPQAVRKELLRTVLRETLKYNGFPASWIVADAISTTSPRNEPGIHVRLVIRHWDSRLPQYAVAFQHHFEARLHTLDPQAGHWLMGVSWQYELPAEAQWPALPPPATWATPVAVPEKEMTAPAPAVTTRTRADLEREMAEADERARGSQNDFEATQVLDVRGDSAGGATPPGASR